MEEFRRRNKVEGWNTDGCDDDDDVDEDNDWRRKVVNDTVGDTVDFRSSNTRKHSSDMLGGVIYM